MKNRQKAIIVQLNESQATGLQELNSALSRGWRIVHAGPMGGAARSLASLVIIEWTGQEVEDMLELVQEEVEDILEEIEGDGATPEIEDNRSDDPFRPT